MNLIERLFIPDYSLFTMIAILSIQTAVFVMSNMWLWLIAIPVFIVESWIQYSLFGEYEDEDEE